MIQTESCVNVSDNTGAKRAHCIKVLGGSRKRYAGIGDIIKVSLGEVSSRGKVKRGEIYHALVIRTKVNMKRCDGMMVRFYDNSVILLTSKLEPLGSRVFGPVPRELKDSPFTKVTTLAQEVI